MIGWDALPPCFCLFNKSSFGGWTDILDFGKGRLLLFLDIIHSLKYTRYITFTQRFTMLAKVLGWVLLFRGPLFTPLTDQYKSVWFLCYFVCVNIMFWVVSVLLLGLWCHLGVFGNIGRDVSSSWSREHTQKLRLLNMRRSYLSCVHTTWFRTVSNIWSTAQLNG